MENQQGGKSEISNIELECAEGDLRFLVNRREFLGAAGAGIFLFFTIGKIPAMAVEGENRKGKALPTDFNAFLKIGADGHVDCMTGKIEMGQGIHTGLALMLAEEMDISPTSIRMIMGDTDLCPWDMGTWGSLSTRAFGPALQSAGAEARMVLLELAAERLKTKIEKLEVENGVVFVKGDKNLKVTYAELAQGGRIERHMTGKVAVKKPSEFKILGKSASRTDAHLKVTGAAKFAGDIQFPDLLHAKILRLPYHGAKFLKIDTSQAKSIAGVHVVRGEKNGQDFVAVLHRNPETASLALRKIKTTVAPRSKVKADAKPLDDMTIFEHLLKEAPEPKVVGEAGNPEKEVARSKTVFENTYYNDYVAHAPMEPHVATLQFDGKQANLWASTQTPFTAGEEAAKILEFRRRMCM